MQLRKLRFPPLVPFSLSLLGSINNSYKLFITPIVGPLLLDIQSFLILSLFSNYSSDLKLDFRLLFAALRKETTFV